MGTQGLEHPSLLPSVLLGDGDDARPGRSTRDWVVDITAFALAIVVGGAFFAETVSLDPSPTWIVTDIVCGVIALVALWWRRRFPVAVALLTIPAGTVSSLASIACVIALFTVAVHRPFRIVAAIAALNLLTIPLFFGLRPSNDPFLVQAVIGVLVTVASVAWGMFVRARRQLVLSLRERARRAEDEQGLRVQQAQRMERDRIAREMHDVLAHRISLVSLHAGALEYAAAAASPNEVARAAGVIRSAAHQALEDLREVIGVLREDDGGGGVERPQPTLDDLDSLLEESRAAGMRVRSDGPLPAGVPASIGRSAYRIVQEGLTNARKHAPSCAVEVTVSGEPGDGLTVEVRNPAPDRRRRRRHPGRGDGDRGARRARHALGRPPGARAGGRRVAPAGVAALGRVVTPIRVLIVDDDALVRAGLSMILNATEDVRVVAEAADGSEVLAAVDAYRPDVVLMDIRMRRMDGLAATEALCERDEAPQIIVLTTFDADDHVLRALRSGASGFLLKDTPPADIVQAVRLVAAGEAMLSPAVTRKLIGHVADTGLSARRAHASELLERLTEREREVAEAIGRGASNAEIAEELFMSVATVKAHVTRLLTKLEVRNRVQIALLAHDAGG